MPNYKKSHRFTEIENLTEIQKGYLAGMIDADGSITAMCGPASKAGVKGMPSPMILVVNTHYELIEWLKSTLGAGCAYKTKTKPTRPDQNEANWNPVHRYQLTGRPAKLLASLLEPFLIVKKRHARLLDMLPLRGIDYTFRASEEQREHAFKVLAEMRELNRRF